MIHCPEEPWKYYNKIRSGLVEAAKNSGNYVTVGQIFESITRGDWKLYLFNDSSGDYTGFAIVEPLPTALGVWANVVFAYSKTNMYLEFFGKLSKEAYENGFCGVKFISSRPGFQRVAEKYKWKKGFTEWIVSDFTEGEF